MPLLARPPLAHPHTRPSHLTQRDVTSHGTPRLRSDRRGMRSTGISKEMLKESLQQWLDLSVNNNVPISLLIMSRTFFLKEELTSLPNTGDTEKSISGLQDAISGMDEEVVNSVLLEVATPEEARKNIDVLKVKIDVLESENEKIDEEFEARQKKKEKEEEKKKEKEKEKEKKEKEKKEEEEEEEEEGVEEKKVEEELKVEKPKVEEEPKVEEPVTPSLKIEEVPDLAATEPDPEPEVDMEEVVEELRAKEISQEEEDEEEDEGEEVRVSPSREAKPSLQ